MLSTNKVYNGCATRYTNGTRLLIGFKNGEQNVFV